MTNMAVMSVTELMPQVTPDAAIGARVHQLLFIRKMTQASLATALGVAQTSVSKKLRGTVGWSASDVIAVSHALNTSVAYLFGETSNPTPGGPSSVKSSTSD